MDTTDQRKLATRSDYGKISKIYADDFGDDHTHFDFVDQVLGLVANKNAPVIDLGAGSGVVSDYLLARGFTNITAVDITPEFCSMMQTKYGSNVNVVCDDMVAFLARSKNASVGAYIANYSIIHIPDEEVDQLFTETTRTLIDGGVFMMSCHKGTYKGMETEAYQSQNDGRLSANEKLEVYLNYFTEEELTSRLANAGLRLVRMETFETEPVPGEIPVPKIWLLAQK